MALFSRIFEYLDFKPELTEATENAQLADASLTLQHVSYRYPGTDTDAWTGVVPVRTVFDDPITYTGDPAAVPASVRALVG